MAQWLAARARRAQKPKKRGVRVVVYMSEDEAAKITADAAVFGWSRSRYIRNRILKVMPILRPIK